MNFLNKIDFAGYIISFILGYFICKKKSQIIVFFRSLKYFLKSYKNKDSVYNEFFEENFDKSDYIKESDNDV